MLESILTTSATTGTISGQEFILCTLASLVLGLCAAGIYMFRNSYSKNFVVTLALLPAMIQIVIMMVNGNVGTGIAVMGAFNLVRFRSVPGSAREISGIFLTMALGLATGMGYIGIAALFLVIIGAMNFILSITHFGERKHMEKKLKITIPESLDYTGIFDDLFDQYVKSSELVRVKTTNMGSLYELHYRITLKDENQEKNFIDEIRCRNGNLNIICSKISTEKDEL